MKKVFVVQYTTIEHPFLHIIHSVTNDESLASETAGNLMMEEEVYEAGYEATNYFKVEVDS